MTKYGKIICGSLDVPKNYPCSINVNGVTVNNPSDADYAAAGYMPIIESQPECVDGKVAIASYVEDNGRIIQHWTYEDAPADEMREE